MCFKSGDTKVAPPAPPAETLDQVAPEKKTAAKPTNVLAIGTKKYRNENGISAPAVTSPTGIALSK